MKEFLKRLAVVAIGIPLGVWIIYFGGYAFLTVIAVLSSVTLWEFYKILETKGTKPLIINGIIFHNIILLLCFYFLQSSSRMLLLLLINSVLIGYALFILILIIYRKSESPTLDFTATITGIIYISASFASLLIIRNLFEFKDIISGYTLFKLSSHETAGLVMSIFISVWVCDTAAYLGGKAFGKHKLIPAVSPKKTWEGAISGFIFAVASIIFAGYYLSPSINIFHLAIIGTIVGTLGQIGDLAESKLKRDAGIKDSSNIIPGHGGFLDRFDSVLFVFPFSLLYLLIFALISGK